MKNKSIRKSRFTLIELLVVIGIIGILTGILLPAISGSMKEGKKTKARSTCKQIAIAVQGYLNDYGSLPKEDNGSDSSETVGTTLLDILGGTNNARNKVYYENSGSVLHPFGGSYTIVMDGNYDNQVTANGETVGGVVAVYTTCDGDTVYSWEK